jgi:LmbE family N-acetylglucosaminyl deacetylase
MKLPRRILVVGAHCDDVELLAGGLLARACREMHSVSVLVFSDHRSVLSAAEARLARDEMRANVAALAASGAPVVDLTDRLLGACNGDFDRERASIYAVMEAVRDRFDLVVTHSPSDTNQDHQRVAAEAVRVFKAHATLLAGEFPNNDVGGFRAQVYVPLEAGDVAAKATMLERYESQKRHERPYLDGDLVRAQARVRGAQVRVGFAEAFEVLGRLIVRGD